MTPTKALILASMLICYPITTICMNDEATEQQALYESQQGLTQENMELSQTQQMPLFSSPALKQTSLLPYFDPKIRSVLAEQLTLVKENLAILQQTCATYHNATPEQRKSEKLLEQRIKTINEVLRKYEQERESHPTLGVIPTLHRLYTLQHEQLQKIAPVREALLLFTDNTCDQSDLLETMKYLVHRNNTVHAIRCVKKVMPGEKYRKVGTDRQLTVNLHHYVLRATTTPAGITDKSHLIIIRNDEQDDLSTDAPDPVVRPDIPPRPDTPTPMHRRQSHLPPAALMWISQPEI